jgi:hypothetical protein
VSVFAYHFESILFNFLERTKQFLFKLFSLAAFSTTSKHPYASLLCMLHLLSFLCFRFFCRTDLYWETLSRSSTCSNILELNSLLFSSWFLRSHNYALQGVTEMVDFYSKHCEFNYHLPWGSGIFFISAEFLLVNVWLCFMLFVLWQHFPHFLVIHWDDIFKISQRKKSLPWGDSSQDIEELDMKKEEGIIKIRYIMKWLKVEELNRMA